MSSRRARLAGLATVVVLIGIAGCGGQRVQDAESPRSGASSGTATPNDRPSSAPPASSPAGPTPRQQPQESDETVESCPGLPRYLSSPHSKIPNPCAQYTEIARLFHRNHYWKKNYGFGFHYGYPDVKGLKLSVRGNIENARELLADNPLVASVELGHIRR